MTNELLSELSVVIVNWCYGGLKKTGDDSDWLHTASVINAVKPHVVLSCQMDAGPVRDLWPHVHRTANELGMQPVPGTSAAVRSTAGNHVAIFVRTSAGLRIHDQWPTLDGTRACWCSAEIGVPGLADRLHFYAVHLNARSANEQLTATQEITSILFDQIIESHAEGVAKPERAFYRRLIAAADCPPGRILHVGNRLDASVLVPCVVGMGAAYVCPYADPGVHLPDGVWHIPRFSDLPDQLRSCA